MQIIQMLKLEENSSYKYRMSSLFALTKMAEILQANEICCFILPNILNMVDDPVPNIRFNVAKSLQVLIPLLLPENHYKQQEYAYRVVSLIKDPLTKLCDDSDSDVQFYSTRALNTLEIIESNINSSSMGTRQLINSNL
jgi:serine/threonine-protein phosphatase 2A regulatory subunit A